MALRWEVNAEATLPVAMPWLHHLLLWGMDRLLTQPLGFQDLGFLFRRLKIIIGLVSA